MQHLALPMFIMDIKNNWIVFRGTEGEQTHNKWYNKDNEKEHSKKRPIKNVEMIVLCGCGGLEFIYYNKKIYIW